MSLQLHDTEIEKSLLVAMVDSITGEAVLLESIGSLQLDDFHEPMHREMYEIILGLYERGVKPSCIEVSRELQKYGTQPLNTLLNNFTHYVYGGNASYYIAKLRGYTKLRRLAEVMRTAANAMRQDNPDADAILLDTEDAIYRLQAATTADTVDTPEQLAADGCAEVEARYNNRGRMDGLRTGITKLDAITYGYKPGDMVLLGSKTGHGKTAFALNTARRIAVVDKLPLLYVNTEMSKKQILLRWGAILSGLDHDKIRSGYLTQDEFVRVQQCYGQLHQSGFYSYYCPNLTPQKLLSVARKYHIQKRIRCVIVDYIGRMDKQQPDRKEWEVLEQIVKSIKILAQTLDIVAIGLVQLTDEENLQGARRMENEADLFMKFKPMQDDELLRNPGCNYWLYVQKNRDGEGQVNIPVMFNKRNQIITDAREA